jgi:hypothetical protein
MITTGPTPELDKTNLVVGKVSRLLADSQSKQCRHPARVHLRLTACVPCADPELDKTRLVVGKVGGSGRSRCPDVEHETITNKLRMNKQPLCRRYPMAVLLGCLALPHQLHHLRAVCLLSSNPRKVWLHLLGWGPL